MKTTSVHYLHFYLLAFGILEEEFHPGFPIIGGAFQLRELISPQYGLQGKGFYNTAAQWFQ